MKLTIGKSVIFWFLALVLIGAGIGAFSFSRLRKIRTNAVEITTDCLPGEAASGDIQLEVADLDRLVLRHVAAESKTEKDALAGELAKKREELNKLFDDYEKTVHDAKDRELFTALQT